MKRAQVASLVIFALLVIATVTENLTWIPATYMPYVMLVGAALVFTARFFPAFKPADLPTAFAHEISTISTAVGSLLGFMGPVVLSLPTAPKWLPIALSTVSNIIGALNASLLPAPAASATGTQTTTGVEAPIVIPVVAPVIAPVQVTAPTTPTALASTTNVVEIK